MAIKITLPTKKEYLELLKKFNDEAKHLSNGLFTSKVVFIEDGSSFIKLKYTSLEEALPLFETKKVSYPALLTAETPRTYLTLDVKINKIREQYTLEFEATPVEPIQDFLVRDYEMQLEKFIKAI